MKRIKTAFWAVRYGLSFTDAGLLHDALRDTASRKIMFSDGTVLRTARRMDERLPIRGSVHDYTGIYAVSKDSVNLVQSSLLKNVLRIILGFNKLHGGKRVSSNAKSWRSNYDRQ